jgi:hypothetical protein
MYLIFPLARFGTFICVNKYSLKVDGLKAFVPYYVLFTFMPLEISDFSGNSKGFFRIDFQISNKKIPKV